jgi:hypothetical protein
MPEKRDYPLPIEMGPEHRAALRAVLDYLWEAERSDCEANPTRDHMFTKLALLSELCGPSLHRDTRQAGQPETCQEQLADKWAKEYHELCDRAEANEVRIRRFAEVLPYYPHTDDYTNATDLLADCIHWCKREGVSFEDLLTVARDHFTTEWAQQPDQDHEITR